MTGLRDYYEDRGKRRRGEAVGGSEALLGCSCLGEAVLETLLETHDARCGDDDEDDGENGFVRPCSICDYALYYIYWISRARQQMFIVASVTELCASGMRATLKPRACARIVGGEQIKIAHNTAPYMQYRIFCISPLG